MMKPMSILESDKSKSKQGSWTRIRITTRVILLWSKNSQITTQMSNNLFQLKFNPLQWWKTYPLQISIHVHLEVLHHFWKGRSLLEQMVKTWSLITLTPPCLLAFKSTMETISKYLPLVTTWDIKGIQNSRVAALFVPTLLHLRPSNSSRRD